MLQDFQNKRVTVMGLGLYAQGTGIEAVKFFLRHGANVTVTDLRSASDLAESVEGLVKYYNRLPKEYNPTRPPLKLKGGERRGYGSGGVIRKLTFILGRHREEDFKNVDLVFQNPSVPADSPYLKIARKHKIPIVNDWSLFLSRHTPKLFVGVTGTRGKSTTTELIYEMIKKHYLCNSLSRTTKRVDGCGERGNGAQNNKVWLAGNLGVSPLSFIDKYKGEPIVAELSSWLLHHFAAVKKSPNIAVVTNIMNDHMDKYGSPREYIEDKENIFRFQKYTEIQSPSATEIGSRPIVVLNYDDPRTRAMAQKARGKVVWFSLKKNWPKWVPLSAVLIPGEHNKANALAAAAAAEAAGVSREHIIDVLKTFKGLSNRLQLVRTVRGARYYNDTTATTPDATIAALITLGRQQIPNHKSQTTKKIVLIAGGADKKLEYREMAKYVGQHCKAVVLLPGSATSKLESGIKNQESGVVCVKSMKEAVKKAQMLAQKGDIVLLSPAAASFGLFDNEFDRGKQFVACVKKL